MEVKCPKCKTLYDFEDTLIGPKGTVVRCTQCGYMFKIFRAQSQDAIETAGWMVRKKNGSVFNIDRFSTLQKWILDGKLTMGDELSRTGKTWKKIGDIVELSGLFKLAQIEMSQQAGAAEDVPTTEFKATAAAQVKRKLEPRPSVTPMHEEAWDEMEDGRETLPHKEPSPEFQKGEEGTKKGPLARTLEPDQEVDDGESIMKPVIAPARGKKIAIIVIVLVILIPLLYLGFFYREHLFKAMGMLKEPTSEEAEGDEKLKKAKELFLSDCEGKWKEAEKIFKAIAEKDPQNLEALVGLAEIYAARAQYLKDRIDFPKLSPGSDEDESKLKGSFMSLVIKARDYASDAVKINAENYEAQRIMADALRLSGDFKDAAEAIDKALDAKSNDAKSVYIQILIDYDQDKDVKNAITGIKRALRKDEKLVSVRYRLALLLALNGEDEEARKELNKVLDAQEDHGFSKKLLSALKEGKLLAAATVDDASVDSDVPGDGQAAAEQPAVIAKKEGEEKEKIAGGEYVPSGKSYDYYYKQGNKLQNQGNCTKAIEYFKKALAENSSSAEAWTGIGHCHRDLGRKGDAVNAYRKALNFNSRFGPAIIGLAEIFKQQGKYKLALEYYKKYLEVFSAGPQANIARRNVEELEDLLKSKGELGTEGEEKPPTKPTTDEEKGSDSGGSGPTVIKTTEEEVKGSIGQPTSDTPKTGLDPYD